MGPCIGPRLTKRWKSLTLCFMYVFICSFTCEINVCFLLTVWRKIAWGRNYFSIILSKVNYHNTFMHILCMFSISVTTLFVLTTLRTLCTWPLIYVNCRLNMWQRNMEILYKSWRHTDEKIIIIIIISYRRFTTVKCVLQHSPFSPNESYLPT